jgi:hypothetical protein
VPPPLPRPPDDFGPPPAVVVEQSEVREPPPPLPARESPGQTVELVVWQNAVSFAGKMYPCTPEDLQSGEWPEGVPVPPEVTDVVLIDRRTQILLCVGRRRSCGNTQ